MSYLTCIHRESGLCAACQEEFDADLDGWIGYGNHPAGIAAWRELQEEMARELPEALLHRDEWSDSADEIDHDDSELPF